MNDEVAAILKSRQAGPFLFVGSGFSRRYIGLEDWRGLLTRFSVMGKPFEYYLANADGDFPLAAAQLAREFNEHWWTSNDYKSIVEKDQSKIADSTSALRIEISRYLSGLDQSVAMASQHADEVELLAGLNVDGIITTNWDLLLEQMFPGYRVFIGQQELLFSNPQQIGEIYKIHGCSTRPASLVLTSDDYRNFNERNAYLAAKLITIFVEHPVIFIGYSLSDKNIASLLKAISLCIGKDNVAQLRRNLIFVQRCGPNDVAGLSETVMTIDGVHIPLVLVRTADFKPIYLALGEVRRKIPARILRYCKEQLYALVASAEPEKKLCVVDYDEIDKNQEVEFLVGVGVASQGTKDINEVAAYGYAAIGANDLFHDLLHEDRAYDAKQILEHVVKRAGKNTKNIPVFKYLRSAGINSREAYEVSGLDLAKWVDRDFKDFRVDMYVKQQFRLRHLSMRELIDRSTAENAAGRIPCMQKDKLDVQLLKSFLLEHEQKLYAGTYASNFRKLATLFDKLRWGW